jgi:hypothetical protein
MKVFLLFIGVIQMAGGCSGREECSSQPQNFASCSVEHQTCVGPVACRSCNATLALWALEPTWECGCETNTLNGRTGLYWQCALAPVCAAGPDTFTDSQCTKTAAAAGKR